MTQQAPVALSVPYTAESPMTAWTSSGLPSSTPRWSIAVGRPGSPSSSTSLSGGSATVKIRVTRSALDESGRVSAPHVTTIDGVPVHALLVHAVVVLIPLAALPVEARRPAGADLPSAAGAP